MKYLLEEEFTGQESFHQEKVLVVDDNEMNLRVTKLLLEDQGIIVDTAMDGEEALEKYLASGEFDYRTIFLDINMCGMDGYDTARAIRNANRGDSARVPIFAMSANIMAEHRKKAQEAGMNGYVTKPIAYGELFSMLHQVFQSMERSGEEEFDGVRA